MMVFWPWLMVAAAGGVLLGWIIRDHLLGESMPSFERNYRFGRGDDDPNN